jgi:formate dehydrogenase subunit beta
MLPENDIEERLRNKVKDVLDDLDLLIGYSQSRLAGRVNPYFVTDEKEIGSLIYNMFCINNLASYAYFKSREYKSKIGIILKPCDAKTIVQLISEGLLEKDKIFAIVAGCSGAIDFKKIQKQVGGARISDINIKDSKLEVDTIDKTFNFNTTDFYAEKCYSCKIYDNPPYFNEFIENSIKPELTFKNQYQSLDEFEKQTLKEIYDFWEKEFKRCIRCYACRNICPLEVCRDNCIAQLDIPHWQSQKINSDEGKFFQQIRAFHLAGRCTECGECERACPANIPIVTLMKKVNKDILKLFDFVPGTSIDAKPPLLTFKNVEKNIKEEELI